MSEISKRFNISKDTNEDAVERIFIKTFSKQFYDKVVYKILKELKINVSNIFRINQYVSENGEHSFVCVAFTNKEIKSSDLINIMRTCKAVIRDSGYRGISHNRDYKKYFGKSRKSVEIPLIWKTSLRPKSYCLLFERFTTKG